MQGSVHPYWAGVKCGIIALLFGLLWLPTGCGGRPAAAPRAIRLVDLYRPSSVVCRVPATAQVPARTEWRFAGGMEGWEAGPGVTGLAVRGGRLAGRSSTNAPLLHLERTVDPQDRDLLYAVEVRLRVSAGSRIGVEFDDGAKVDLADMAARAKENAWRVTVPLPPSSQGLAGEAQTVSLHSPYPVTAAEARHVVLRPTDAAGASFEIESVRLVWRREHLAAIPSGVSWQGLSEIYHETLMARAPEELRFRLTVPPRAFLDLALGTVEEGPVTFRVGVRREGGLAETAETEETLLTRTVTTPHRWEAAPIDLTTLAGQQVTLSLALAAERPGALGLWGSPVVRSRVADRAGERDGLPRGVILIWADTLRRDHLSAYGYRRDTSPTLRALAAQGALFTGCVTQATWTKVATPSLLASLYPTTHGVTDFADRLPSSATTLAEVYRRSGWATLSLSSIFFTGQFTNLHRGFEELHEDGSLSDHQSSKTAREYVDRLLPWIDAHREVPFFVFLHLSDPHDPYPPRPPYDALWADPAQKALHARQKEEVRKGIGEAMRQRHGMPTAAEIRLAGLDPQAYESSEIGAYDGAIRGMDAEIGRLIERLRELRLDRKVLLAFAGDHGEEFLEHGGTFHGQSVYGELTEVPLLFWQPGRVPAGRVVGETVEIVDILPTLLAACGLPVPAAAQGQSLLPLLHSGGAGPFRVRPAISEKASTHDAIGSPPPRDTESFAILDGGWKLIHNTRRPPQTREYEFYDERSDPLDQSDLAAREPGRVARLAAELAAWHARAAAARLKPDSERAKTIPPEELERLRSLGYIQ